MKRSDDYNYFIEASLIKSSIAYANSKNYTLAYEKLLILHESTGVRYINKSQLDVLLKNTLSTLIKRLVRDEEKLLFKSIHSLSKHDDRNTPTKAHSIIETELTFITYFTEEIDYKSIQLNYALTTGSFLTYQMKDFYHKSSIILDNRILLLLTKMLRNYINNYVKLNYIELKWMFQEF